MLAMPAGGRWMRENVATTSAELNAVRRGLHPVAQLEGVRLAVRRDLPALGEIRMIVFRPSAGLKRTSCCTSAPDEAERALVHVEVRDLRGPAH